MLTFTCEKHKVGLEVNEASHVFIYEHPEGSNQFDIDMSGLLCPEGQDTNDMGCSEFWKAHLT